MQQKRLTMQSTGAAGHVVSQIRAARRRPVFLVALSGLIRFDLDTEPTATVAQIMLWLPALVRPDGVSFHFADQFQKLVLKRTIQITIDWTGAEFGLFVRFAHLLCIPARSIGRI